MPEQSNKSHVMPNKVPELKHVDSFGDQPRLKLFFKDDARNKLGGVQLPPSMSLGLINDQMLAREPEEFKAPTVKRIQSFNQDSSPQLNEGNVVFVEDSSAARQFDFARF